ncbi:MAG: hypothetical protein IPN03_21335 [Holophagales bacterium]|nr:hypothetical protein [Holophagales bacterium]
MISPAVRAAVTAAVLFVVVLPARGQVSTLETDDLRLVYFAPGQSYLVPHVARSFENALRFHRRAFSYEPSEKVTVFLNDFSDYGNAGVNVVPRNFMMFQVAPVAFTYETVPANETVNWMMNHELVHVTLDDNAGKSDRSWRRVFGGKVPTTPEQPETILYNYLTTPRSLTPRWYHEGAAVFFETWMAGGRGRAQSAWDEMVFRSMVRDGSRFYTPLGLVSEGTKVDFQLEANSYVYGGRFMTFLAYRYSPEKLVEWLGRREGSKAYYASQFRQVFGKPIPDAWQEWVDFEKEFQEKNLAAIRTYPTTPYEDLSPQALGSVSRAFYDPDARKLYAAFNHPGVVAHVGAISVDDGKVERIAEIKGPLGFFVTSLAWDPGSKTLFYTTDNADHRDVRSLDPRTGASKILLEEARIGELVFNRADRSLWGVRTMNGIATLVRIAAPWTEWKQVRSWPYGESLYDMDLSPDGTLLSFSVSAVTGQHTLQVMRTEALLAGDATPVATTDFGAAIPMNFVFAPDGKTLTGSSFYTGVANLFRWNPATGEKEALSNTETGFFRPLPMPDGSLLAFRFTGEGFVPARVEARVTQDVSPITFLGNETIVKHPVLEEWKVPPPSVVDLEPLVKSRATYRSFAGIGLDSIYPVVQGYKNSAAVGLRVNLSDPVQLNKLNLTAAYSPDGSLPSGERLHLDARYERYDWSARVRWNAGDFYDLVGPTKTSMKGYSFRVGWQKALLYDRPRELRVEANATYYGGLDRLPDFQNVATAYDTLFALRARLHYRNERHSLGYVDEEKGHAWEIGFAGDRVGGRSYPKAWGTYDVGFALPLRHSSVWVRSTAGWTPRVENEPFASFYFGGFGNNWVDYRPEKRYREFLSFPGVEIDEIPGSNFARAMLEWNLPPIRFRKAGTADVYVSWARPALFASAMVTNMDSEPDLGTDAARHVVGNAGAQVDFRIFMLSRLELTLSVGQAFAFEEGLDPRAETMVSLKILK